MFSFRCLNFLFLGSIITKNIDHLTNNTSACNVKPVTENFDEFHFDEMLKDLEEISSKFNETSKTATRRSLFFRSNVPEDKKSHLQRMVKYAAASYCSDSALNLWNCQHCKALGEKTKLIGIYKDNFTGTKAILALDHSNKSINVAFRGSSNLRNWIGNLNFKKVKYADIPDAKVHQGFMRCADALKHKIVPDLKNQIKLHLDYHIKIIGHSLGGAIASLAALEFRRILSIPDSKLELISFGEPRVGNEPFANYYTHQKFHTLRVVHNNDIVPHVPLSIFNYYHRKRLIYSKSNTLYNCHPDNWFHETCKVARNFGKSITDHLNYFGINVGNSC